MRRKLGLAAAVLLGALCVVAGHYARMASRLFRPPRVAITQDDRDTARKDIPGVTEVTLHAPDGPRLSGFYAPPRSGNGSVVVMAHGVGANRMQLLSEAEILSRHGYGVLFFDWRGHGDSEGDVTTWGDREQSDFTAAVDFATAQPDVHADRIAGLGFSIGASVVSLVAARDSRLRAVVLEAVYPSFSEEMGQMMGSRGVLSLWPTLATARWYGVRPDNIRPIDHVGAIAPRPVLFIDGDQDPNTPLPVMKRVYDAAGDPKELLVVPGAEHGGYARAAPAEYERVLTQFLDGALLGARTAAER